LDLVLQPLRHFRQHLAVELDAGLFHARQHRHQRKIDLVVDLAQSGFVDFSAQFFGQAQGDVGGFGGRRPSFRLNLRNAVSLRP
jgi:hypothetical protein